MNDELKEIKKIYGEEMMHMCREMFPTILEQEGRLLAFLKERIAPTHSFASDIKSNNLENYFKNWVEIFIRPKQVEMVETDKTPFELMDEAGYTLYECSTEEDIQKFKKYFKKGEELCTFNGGRLNRCHVFFAVKKDVGKIKREDFPNPEREDVYGTSVISIQFSRGDTNTLSIKNRYNHTVDNPDATFGNNLEMIIPGLTKSFEKEYGLNIKKPKNNVNEHRLFYNIKYVLGPDNRYYRYNTEINATYFCSDNIIISDGKIITKYIKNKERYILFDEFVIDLKEKTIEDCSNNVGHAFVTSIKEVGPIKKIDVLKKGENRIITIISRDDKKVVIEIDKNNSIVGYDNPYVGRIYNNFLSYNYNVEYVNLPKVVRIDNLFLISAKKIRSIELPNVIKIDNSFLSHNGIMESFVAPKLSMIGNDFLHNNEKLKHLDIPSIREIGNGFLSTNSSIDTLNMPNLNMVGAYFLSSNECIHSIDLPSLQSVGGGFISGNGKIDSVNIPNLVYAGEYFLSYNDKLKEVSFPLLIEAGQGFLRHNTCLKKINVPKLKEVGPFFLGSNKKMVSICLPSARYISHYFMEDNEILNHIDIPQVETIGDKFLDCNNRVRSISLPNVLKIGREFMDSNYLLSHIDIPNVTQVGENFLYNNNAIVEIEVPQLRKMGRRFLSTNPNLKIIYAPNLESESKYLNPHLLECLVVSEKQK